MALFDHFGLEFSKMRVLFVEDNPFDKSLGNTALNALGFRSVIVAQDGREAMETLEHIPNIDLIISDWNMPVISGIDLLRIARQSWPGVPFLMMTGNDSIQHVVKARKSGVFAYVLKPFTMDVLRKQIIVALRRRLADGGNGADTSDRIYRDAIEQIKMVTDNICDDETVRFPQEVTAFEDAMETLLFSNQNREQHLERFHGAAAALIARDGIDGPSQASVASLIDQLWKFVEGIEVLNAVQLEIIKLHVEAIRAVNLGHLKDTADTAGPGLVKVLGLAIERVSGTKAR